MERFGNIDGGTNRHDMIMSRTTVLRKLKCFAGRAARTLGKQLIIRAADAKAALRLRPRAVCQAFTHNLGTNAANYHAKS